MRLRLYVTTGITAVLLDLPASIAFWLVWCHPPTQGILAVKTLYKLSVCILLREGLYLPENFKDSMSEAENKNMKGVGDGGNRHEIPSRKWKWVVVGSDGGEWESGKTQ